MLPAWPRLIYALPAVPLAFLGLPLYVYLPAHYAALPGIGLAAVGLVHIETRDFLPSQHFMLFEKPTAP